MGIGWTLWQGLCMLLAYGIMFIMLRLALEIPIRAFNWIGRADTDPQDLDRGCINLHEIEPDLWLAEDARGNRAYGRTLALALHNLGKDA